MQLWQLFASFVHSIFLISQQCKQLFIPLTWDSQLYVLHLSRPQQYSSMISIDSSISICSWMQKTSIGLHFTGVTYFQPSRQIDIDFFIAVDGKFWLTFHIPKSTHCVLRQNSPMTIDVVVYNWHYNNLSKLPRHYKLDQTCTGKIYPNLSAIST